MHRMLVITIFGLKIFGSAAVGDAQTAVDPPPSNLKSDEQILFFPTYGRLDEDTQLWRLEVHGKVFEPEASSIKRALLVRMLRKAIGGDDKPFLKERLLPFLVDNERGKSVTISIGGRNQAVGTSTADGHFTSIVTIDRSSVPAHSPANRNVSFQAVLPENDQRVFAGSVQLIEPAGVTVISDIDDTIKRSQVTDKTELLRNTFIRPFQAVDGMADLYAELAGQGVAFHYVSGSPWQLYWPLASFLEKAGFPLGSFHMKHFRLKDSSAWEILGSQQETKFAAIVPLLRAFPKRKFVLIGDSGEQDPEIYGRMYREHPDQILAILIRNVTQSQRTQSRYQVALQDVPGERWFLFDEVTEVRQRLAEVVSDAYPVR